MSEISLIILLTIGSGGCMLIGGLLASVESIRPRWLEQELRHFLIALGGGVLLGAVALVLVPEGKHQFAYPGWSVALVLLGGLTFFALEWRLGLKRRQSPQLMGMVLDYFPEAIALGGMVVVDPQSAWLLAVLIGLQNLPEGFNAFRELCEQNGQSVRRTLLTMTPLTALGPVAGLSGYFFLSAEPAILGAIMLFSAGGILYLIFQDIAPQARLERHWGPPLGAVVGFCFVLLGEVLTKTH